MHAQAAHQSVLECALTLARDLAYIWPRCPHPILSVCNSSIISIGYCIGSTSRYRYLNDISWHYGTCAIITSGREVQAYLDLLRLYYSIAMTPNLESSINKSLIFSLKKSR